MLELFKHGYMAMIVLRWKGPSLLFDLLLNVLSKGSSVLFVLLALKVLVM